MDLFGVGMPEVLVIIVIALVVLGPSRTLNMARSAGKMLGQVRRAMGDLSEAVEREERELKQAATVEEETDIPGRSPPEERR